MEPYTFDQLVNAFWKKVKIIPNSCWNWDGSMYIDGYGKFYIKRKGVKAHRFCFEIWNNIKVPIQLCVCHKCDNRKCCNPDHLFLGTDKDNSDDKIKKGRLINSYYLGKQQIEEIKKVYKVGINTQADVAKQFGISRSYVSQIITGTRTGSALAEIGENFIKLNR